MQASIARNSVSTFTGEVVGVSVRRRRPKAGDEDGLVQHQVSHLQSISRGPTHV